MNDTDYMNLALELARRGMGWDLTQSHGGSCSGEGRRDHRTRVAHPVRRTPRGAGGAEKQYRVRPPEQPSMSHWSPAVIRPPTALHPGPFWTRALPAW